jgi:RNA polymerase sigma factor (sigma-70 family)
MARASFPSTRHSVVDAVRSPDQAARTHGLERLATAYWQPIYSYLRLRWRKSHEAASDLTQELFVQVIERDLLGRFDPARARLRTYLRVCVDGLAGNQAKAATRLKRGGGTLTLSFDFEAARAALEQAASQSVASPEECFEQEWSRSIFALALERFRALCRESGRATHLALFELRDLESGPDPRPTYAELAERFGINQSAVTNWLAAARRDFRRCVLDTLRELTASEAEFRAEARDLLGTEPR